MFESLSERLSTTVQRLRGRGRLTEANIRESLREVRIALLEADVALPVVQALIQRVQVKALGQEVLRSLTPGQALVKVVRDELTAVMGTANTDLNLAAAPPAVVLMAGLQGAGKTTTVAKLAKLLKDRRKKKVMVVSADVYRPAAIEQLRTLAEQVDVLFHPSSGDQDPVAIAKSALDAAKKNFADVLIVDTAGRLHIDAEMMTEIKALHAALNPIETLFVVDSMTGQDAANTAKAFSDALPLTGVILTKTDGDARGGAALSVRYITGRPIKFIGAGEKVDALEPFHPDRIAQRILGMGDVLSFIERAEQQVDEDEAKELERKLRKNQFTLEDFLDQLKKIRRMGPLTSLLGMIPGLAGHQLSKMNVDEKELDRVEAIVLSMTPYERRHPELIKGSRRLRIAKGSGTTVQQVNQLVKQFDQMRKLMRGMQQGKMPDLGQLMRR